MKFVYLGQAAPTTMAMYHDGREYRFRFPYETTDPVEIALLRKQPLVAEEKSKPAPAPLELVDKPRKEV